MKLLLSIVVICLLGGLFGAFKLDSDNKETNMENEVSELRLNNAMM